MKSQRKLTVITIFIFFLSGLVSVHVDADRPPEGPAKSGNEGPIVIGATLSLTGTYEGPSNMIHNGYRLWEKEINENGGLLGRPVELIIIDDQSDPRLSKEGYRRLIDEEQVDLVLSPYSTPITRAASEVTEKNGYVLIACSASGKLLWERGYTHLFGMYATAPRYFIGFLDLIAREGLNSVCIVNENNPFNRDVAEGAVNWAEMMSVTVEETIEFNPETDDLEEIALRIQNKCSQGLIVSTYPPAGYTLLSIMGGNDFKPVALGMSITPVHPAFYEKAAPYGDKVFAPSQWEPIERIPFPGTEDFISDFTDFTGIKPSYHAGSAYAACQILEKAVEKTKSLNHTEMRAYISLLDAVTVIGRFKVDETGKQIGHNPILIQWQSGKKEIVYPPHMRTATPQFD